ncbi:MAG: L-threonylcarbamoyladenylate synthase [Acidobacteria bacterium]|nr:L-threonylcarbamoyladenylate synthase [Acidobacteriota bacterium]
MSPTLPRLPEIRDWKRAAAAAEELWRGGGIVAIPTESTYGLAVDPLDAEAVEAVMRCKGRSAARPLPVVAGSIDDLRALGARLDLAALAPVLAAWPAALTAVVPLDRPVAAALGGDTLAVRIPDHDGLRDFLLRMGRAVTATSANRSGEEPVVTAAEARELLVGERALVIDDGARLPGGPPSTLVGIRDGGLVVLREGRYPVQRLLGF